MGDKQIIGHVLRGSTTGFVCGTNIDRMDAPEFGAFVEAPCGDGYDGGDGVPLDRVIGLIYGIRIEDDPLVRQLILAGNVTRQTREDQRVNRLVPVEISVVNIGYARGGNMHQTLPPRPPLSLAEVNKCDAGDVRAFCRHFDFFRLVLNVPELPSDELLGASLCLAAATFDDDGARRAFLVNAGRELAKLLSQDLVRLENILRLLRAAT